MPIEEAARSYDRAMRSHVAVRWSLSHMSSISPAMFVSGCKMHDPSSLKYGRERGYVEEALSSQRNIDPDPQVCQYCDYLSAVKNVYRVIFQTLLPSIL